MADMRTIPVTSDLDMDELVTKLAQKFKAQGFVVSAMKVGESYTVKLSKDDDGIKKYVGLALGITVTLSRNGETLVLDFTDAEWTGKIVGAIIGWALCFIPLILAAIGALKQLELPNTITNEARIIASGGGTFMNI